MKYVMLVLLLFSAMISAQAQVIDPPEEADEFGWLRWAVIVLLGIVITGSGTFFAFMKTSYEKRIGDRDAEITRLITQNGDLQKRVDDLQGDKDALNKDMQEKVIPALTSASDLLKTFLNSGK